MVSFSFFILGLELWVLGVGGVLECFDLGFWGLRGFVGYGGSRVVVFRLRYVCL